jgi:flagellar L-ring protein precursor FlgH
MAEDKFSTSKSLEEYIREARAARPQLQTSEGSLYSVSAINAELFTDIKARRVNDILTIRILESTEAQSAANAQTNRSSSVSLGLPNFFGLENHTNVPMDQLLTANSDIKFKGDGSTNRSGSVDAFLSARVKEVLPNGDLVIEGVKEIKVNNERQMLRLFGVVRSRDIGPGNVVLSNAIANMLVQVDGKGILSDNITKGWLLGIISRVWPF